MHYIDVTSSDFDGKMWAGTAHYVLLFNNNSVGTAHYALLLNNNSNVTDILYKSDNITYMVIGGCS